MLPYCIGGDGEQLVLVALLSGREVDDRCFGAHIGAQLSTGLITHQEQPGTHTEDKVS